MAVVDAQTVTTLAGGGSGFANGAGTAANFSGPVGLAIDPAGNLYVAEYTNNLIRNVVVSSGSVTTLAGNIAGGSSDGSCTSASFSGPSGVALDSSGNLYVADFGNNLIRKVVPDCCAVTTLAGNIAGGSSDGSGTSASFSNPYGVAVDSAGANLYIGDYSNNLIRVLVISSGAVTTLAGSTGGGYADGVGIIASFTGPTGVAVDTAGNLYVVDNGNSAIRKVLVPSGTVTTLAGSPVGNTGSANGVGTSATFNSPCLLAINKDNNLYISDESNDLLRMIITASGSVSTLAGQGSAGSANGVGTIATFSNPAGMAINSEGTTLYVTDYVTSLIRTVALPQSGTTSSSSSTASSTTTSTSTGSSTSSSTASSTGTFTATDTSTTSSTSTGTSSGKLFETSTRLCYNCES